PALGGYAPDHDGERHGEDDQYDDLSGIESCILKSFIMTFQEQLTMRPPLLGDNRPRWILLDPVGIAHHIRSADNQPSHQEHEPEHDAVGKRNVRSVSRNYGSKRVYGRAQHANSGANKNNGYAGYNIVAGGDHHRDKNGVKREGLLGHAIARAPDGEQCHQDGYHPDFVAFQMPH